MFVVVTDAKKLTLLGALSPIKIEGLRVSKGNDIHALIRQYNFVYSKYWITIAYSMSPVRSTSMYSEITPLNRDSVVHRNIRPFS